MADRTSAQIFSELFKELASDRPVSKRSLADLLWAMQGRRDFSPEQLECNEALERLGLARRKGEEWEYGPQPPETVAQAAHRGFYGKEKP